MRIEKVIFKLLGMSKNVVYVNLALDNNVYLVVGLSLKKKQKVVIVAHHLSVTLSHCLKLHSTTTRFRPFYNDTLD